MYSDEKVFDIADKNKIKILKHCPICGQKVDICHKQSKMRIQCWRDDSVHNAFRKRKYFVDPIDAINEWNSYVEKILNYRKKKNLFSFVIMSPSIASMIYFLFNASVVTFFACSLIAAVWIMLALTLGWKYIVAIKGTSNANIYEEDFEVFLTKEEIDFNKELMNKLLSDNNKIKRAADNIDKNLQNVLPKLTKISDELYDYLLEHSDRVLLASSFINIYQDKVLDLSRKYVTLRDSNKDLAKQIIDTLNEMPVLYKREYDKVIDNYVLDVSAELKVLNQEIAAEKK